MVTLGLLSLLDQVSLTQHDAFTHITTPATPKFVVRWAGKKILYILPHPL